MTSFALSPDPQFIENYILKLYNPGSHSLYLTKRDSPWHLPFL